MVDPAIPVRARTGENFTLGMAYPGGNSYPLPPGRMDRGPMLVLGRHMGILAWTFVYAYVSPAEVW